MKKKTIGVLASLLLVASFLLGGCAKELNAADTAASIGETKYTLGMVNFLVRMHEATYDQYRAYFGEDMWNSDVDGSGQTLGDSVKQTVKDNLKEMYVLDQHKSEYNVEITEEDTAKINEAAKAFMEKNAKVLKGILVTTESDVAEVLRLLTVQSRVTKEIKKGANSKVSDEEAAQRTFSYFRYNIAQKQDVNGNAVGDYTDDEKNEIRKTVGDILTKAKAGENFEDLVKEQNGQVTTYSYGKDESSMDKKVIEAADKLKEGEYSSIVETDQFLYIIRLDKAFDKEATDNKKDSIVTERENELFTKVTEPWLNAVEMKIEDSVWKQITFDRVLNVVSEKTTTTTN